MNYPSAFQRFAVAFALAVSVMASFGQPLRAQSNATWYVVKIGGIPVGWMREASYRADQSIRLTTDMRIVLNRLGSAVVMEMSDKTSEGADGNLLTDDLTMRMSEQATSLSAALAGGKLRITTRAGGQSFERQVDVAGRLLGPEAARLQSADRLRSVGDSIQYQIFGATVSTPVTVTRAVLALDTILVNGAPTAARKVMERSAASPVPVTLWLDADGKLLRSEYSSPFGLTETTLSDSAGAWRANAGGSLAASQYEKTLVKTAIKIPQARTVERLQLDLSSTDSSLEWPQLDGPGQRVIQRDGGHVVLETFRRVAPKGHHDFPVPSIPTTREYLEPNAYVQSSLPAMRSLAHSVIGNEKDLYAASLMLERWVSENMKFDLGIAFAPSIEVLEQRRGTCVAYATLLTALTRAAGIPSRVVFGYVYVNGVFGGHAWTEVLVGPEWVPIDAAITADGSADAARFAFAWSSLAEGPGSLSSSPGSRLYGNLVARIKSLKLAGSPAAVVDSTTAPYEITGNTYRNSWLKISLEKPSDFRFVSLDDTWPSMSVLGLDGPNGEHVRLTSEYRDPWTSAERDAVDRLSALVKLGHVEKVSVGGRSAWLSSSAARAAIAIPNGAETLVIDAESLGAQALVTKVASGLRMPAL